MASFTSEMKGEVEKVKNEVKKLSSQSFAYEILQDQRKQNKRMFVILIMVLIMWFSTIGYLVYVLNDIETITTTETYDMSTDNGNNNFVGGDNNGTIENN